MSRLDCCGRCHGDSVTILDFLSMKNSFPSYWRYFIDPKKWKLLSILPLILVNRRYDSA